MKPRCLNPCCNGTYSPRNSIIKLIFTTTLVLILVVMEHTLRVMKCGIDKWRAWVLILVVMEHTLREYKL